jgi:protein gp37
VAPMNSEELKTTTWNPVTGCDRVSAGCDHCYALAFAGRLKAMGSKKYQTDGDPETSGPGFGLALHPETLKLPYSWRSPRLVFVTSMGDLFHPDVPLEFIQSVFKVMNETPQHTYQLLTKRPGRARKLMDQLDWPANLWFGTSVEDERVTFRIDQLRDTPAPLRFVSCEPLLGPLDHLNLDGIGWVILSGESGPEHRPMQLEWATSIRDQCLAAHVPFYFKQWGGAKRGSAGRELEGRLWNETPVSGSQAVERAPVQVEALAQVEAFPS